MKLFITGSQGQVGNALQQRAAMQNIPVQIFDHTSLDITDAAAVNAAIEQSKPTHVINCAAYTAVDKAETEVELAYAINRDGPAHLARTCAIANIPLLHISTDYIFDGKKTLPYLEDDTPAPLGVYGASKLAGELAVQKYCSQHIILRVSAVFAATGNNFVKTMLRLGQEREQLRIVDDQVTGPTPALAIADTLLAIAQYPALTQTWGTYHFSGAPAATWYEFASQVIRLGKNYWPLKVQDMVPITSADYPTPAQRPHYSVLSCEKIQQTFKISSANWQAGLSDVIQQLSNQ